MADNNKTPAPNSKRALLDKNKTRLFVIISVASVITIGGLVVAKGFISQGNYYSKVIEQKTQARDQLEKNIAAVSELEIAYQRFVNGNPNMLGGNPSNNDDRGGSNADLVLDALPNKLDVLALMSSLEKMLAGTKVNSIGSSLDESGQIGAISAASAGGAELPFAIDIDTSYKGVTELFELFHQSIRPISINTVELTGSNSALNAKIGAKSYYQPATGLQITEGVVQ